MAQESLELYRWLIFKVENFVTYPMWFYGVISCLAVTVVGIGSFALYRRLFAKAPLRLATGWNVIHKRVSSWLAVVALGLAIWADQIADALHKALDFVPPGVLSPGLVQGISVAMMVLKFFAMLWQQRSLIVQAKPAGPLGGPTIDRGSR